MSGEKKGTKRFSSILFYYYWFATLGGEISRIGMVVVVKRLGVAELSPS